MNKISATAPKDNQKHKLVLASASPRRLELLKNMGFEPDQVLPTDVDETPRKQEKPDLYTKRIAIAKAVKAKELLGNNKDTFIVAADTIAAVGTRILGKPADEQDARKIMNLLSGKKHRVYTCVVVISPEGTIRLRLVTTFVKFKRITEEELNDYIATNYWVGKAGAYGLQEDPGGFVVSINGSYSSVVGLPLYETKNLLKGLGFKR